MSKKGNINVIYLSWLPYGPGHFEAFLQSYKRYPAGAHHELLIVFNGVDDDAQLAPFKELLTRYEVNAHSIQKRTGQDIEAYFEAANTAQSDLLVFFNTYCQLLGDNWLRHYQQAIEQEGVALVGASASWQSYYEIVLRQLHDRRSTCNPRRGSVAYYKLWLKASLYWRLSFRPFPNPHIRSNAFMMRREDFLSIRHLPISNKFRAYLFESGKNSMTRQVLQKGYKAVVIGIDGHSYSLDYAKDAKVFWSGRQENLLVSDNQTRLYEQADEATRKELFMHAWCNNAAYQQLKTSSSNNRQMKDYIVTGLSYLRRPSKRKLIGYSYQLRGKKGLEIGGPSSQYALMGNFPVYLFSGQIDGVNYSTETVWEGTIKEGYTYKYHNKTGYQYIREAVDLSGIADASYDFILSCHSLEHVANPLQALQEWMRVLKPGGMCNLILPDKRNTFDINRPYTTMQHLLEDLKANTLEDDTTHFEEILRTHDQQRDPGGNSAEEIAVLLKDNLKNRRAHHHVFDFALIKEMLTWAGCEVLHQQAAPPFHLITVARKKAR